jgi:hypothetical protein
MLQATGDNSSDLPGWINGQTSPHPSPRYADRQFGSTTYHQQLIVGWAQSPDEVINIIWQVTNRPIISEDTQSARILFGGYASRTEDSMADRHGAVALCERVDSGLLAPRSHGGRGPSTISTMRGQVGPTHRSNTTLHTPSPYIRIYPLCPTIQSPKKRSSKKLF